MNPGFGDAVIVTFPGLLALSRKQKREIGLDEPSAVLYETLEATAFLARQSC